MSKDLVLLKLGGSLITDKTATSKARMDVIARLCTEIAEALKANPDLRVILGHGSGSYGHVPAKKHGTKSGVRTEEDWHGFVDVWRQAAALNRIVADGLAAAGIRAIVLPPSASVTAKNGRLDTWDLGPLKSALEANLMPVVYGDVVFDQDLGGTILSTEDLFAYIAKQLNPRRILLAGDEAGVFDNYSTRVGVISMITPQSYPGASLGAAAGADVTGGMAGKVQTMFDLIKLSPDIEVSIFSGLEPGNIRRALQGEKSGTILKA